VSHHASGPDFAFPRGDARLDMTDFYAFPKPGDTSKSILILNVHPSVGVKPPGPTTTEPFAAGALYEIKIDTNGDVVDDVAYSVQVSTSEAGGQTATLRRVQGTRSACICDNGEVILEEAPVSIGPQAFVTSAGEYRFFGGLAQRSFLFASSEEFVGSDERQRAASPKNRRNMSQVASKEDCSSSSA
jgi:Domain of unknown function (DUF4331)